MDQIPAIRGIVLRHTMLGELYVLLIAAAVALATGVAMLRRPFPIVRRGLPWLIAAVLVASVVMTFARPSEMALLTHESHALEWTSVAALLAACLLAATIALRADPSAPRPLGAFISAGLFVALARELQFGEPFLGEKVVSSRYFFRPAAWVDPSRFADLSEETGVSCESLRLIHLVAAAVMFAILGAVAVYIFRRRCAFADQFRRFARSVAGACFFVGLGLYVGTQIVGRSVEKWVAGAAPDWAQATNFSNSFIDEPLEFAAALCLAMSVLRLWHGELPATCEAPTGSAP